MAKAIKKQEQYELIPAGPDRGVISRVLDLGLQAAPPQAEDKTPRWQYGIAVEFPDELQTDGRPRVLWITPNESLNAKSTLGKLVAAAGIMPEDNWDPEQLVDANVTVLIEHKLKDNTTYSNIAGFACAPRNSQPIKAVRKDVEPPEWIKRKIANRLDNVPDPFAGGNNASNANQPNW